MLKSLKLSVCVWVRMKNENYFTIQRIFATIYDSIVLFDTIMNPTILFQLTFTFIYSIFNNNFSVLAK